MTYSKHKLIGLIVVTLCALMACNSKHQESSKSVTNSNVASLKDPISDVSVRKAKQQLWDPAQADLGLNNYDSVKTGAASSGVIKYSDFTKVDVGENTLVVVLDRKTDNENEHSVMGLPKGSIDGNLSKKTSKKVELVVRTSRGWITASNQGQSSKVRFKATITKKGALRVTSNEGEVRVLAKQKEKIVKQNQTLTVAAPIAGFSSDQSDANLIATVESEELPDVSENEWLANQEVIAPVKDGAAITTEKNVPSNMFKIESPKSLKVSVKQRSIQISGIAGRKMKVIMNGEDLLVNADGRFLKKLNLNPGINILTFQIIGPTLDEVRYETYEVLRTQ